MGKNCESHHQNLESKSCQDHHPRVKWLLWTALVLNFSMFGIELLFGFYAESMALKADAIDFLSDSLNYGVSLLVVSSALGVRARAAQLKALSMMGLAFFVLGKMIYSFFYPALPVVTTMTWIGALALTTNLFVAFLLYKFREGDSNLQSAWLCSRNDAIGNLSVLGAALLISITGQRWPDLVVACFMSYLAVTAGTAILKNAKQELMSSSKNL